MTHACFSRRGSRGGRGGGCGRSRRGSRRRICSGTGSYSNAGNGSSDFSCSSVIDEEILRENATLNIISGITSVALASVVVDLCCQYEFFEDYWGKLTFPGAKVPERRAN